MSALDLFSSGFGVETSNSAMATTYVVVFQRTCSAPECYCLDLRYDAVSTEWWCACHGYRPQYRQWLRAWLKRHPAMRPCFLPLYGGHPSGRAPDA